LKASGNWLDAYGLWVMLHNKEVPLLYNPGFDQPLQPDGFDWEYSTARRSRAGYRAEIVPITKRGLVLDVDFTGRTFVAPVVRQILFPPPGTYIFRGEYMVTKLRSEGGLAWTVAAAAAASQRRAALLPCGKRRLLEDGGVRIHRGAGLRFRGQPAAGNRDALRGGNRNTRPATFDAFSLTRAVSSPE
jgi:hypothetical protein